MDTKEKLLHAGARLFADESFGVVSVDDIVRKAEISKGAFYHYFKSKDEFYDAILRNGFALFGEMYGRRSAEAGGKEPLLVYIETVFAFFERSRHSFIILSRELTLLAAGKKSRLLPYQKESLERVRSMLPAGASGEMLAHTILGLIRSAVLYQIQTESPMDDVVRETWRYVKACVGAPA